MSSKQRKAKDEDDADDNASVISQSFAKQKDKAPVVGAEGTSISG